MKRSGAHARKDQAGFTLPELVVVLGVTALFVSLILYFGISYWRYGLTLASDSDTLVTRLNIQDYLREQVGTSAGLINQNSLPDNTALNPDTTIPGDNYWQKIHATTQTYTATGSGTTPLLYYKRFSVNTSNTYIMNGSQPYEDEFILYLDNANKQVLVRSIANTGAPSNKLVTSCAPAAATTACPADKVIATDISSITTRYFSRSGNIVDWTSVYDPLIGQYIGPDFPNAEVAEFTIKLAQRPGLEKTKTTQNTTVVRIALRNT
jgi:prepilin-type N-terminal cleavage/methylation domain-containing protein